MRTGVSSCPPSLPAPYRGHIVPKAGGSRERRPPWHPAEPGQAAVEQSRHPALSSHPAPLTLDPSTTGTSTCLPRCSRGAVPAGKAAGAATEHNGAIEGRAGTAQWGLVCWPRSRSCPARAQPRDTPFAHRPGAHPGASPCLGRASEYCEGAAGGRPPGSSPSITQCPGKEHGLGNFPAWCCSPLPPLLGQGLGFLHGCGVTGTRRWHLPSDAFTSLSAPRPSPLAPGTH